MTLRHPTSFRLILLLMALPAAAHIRPAPGRNDVFVTTPIEVVGVERLRKQLHDVRITVHRIDVLEQVKATLSRDLPVKAETAKRLALERMQHLNKDDHDRLRQAGESLLLVWQLGVQRYPAIVFDRLYVVYGMTDLPRAYAFFQKQKVEENR